MNRLLSSYPVIIASYLLVVVFLLIVLSRVSNPGKSDFVFREAWVEKSAAVASRYKSDWDAFGVEHHGAAYDRGSYHFFVKTETRINFWWSLALLVPLPLSIWLRMQRVPSGKGLCLKCGYDLRGNQSGVCPECGSEAPASYSTVAYR